MWAEITAGTVTNILVCDDSDYATDQGWVPIDDVTPTPGIGWSYDGTSWTAPDPTPPPPEQIPVTVDADTLSDLVDQVTSATTVAQVKAALLATLNALGAGS